MTDRFETPQDAEDTFYDAFEENDLGKMMGVWADSEDIICIAPMRKQALGRVAVRKIWEELFASDVKVEVEIHHQCWIEMSDVALHLVHEQLIFNEDRQRMPPPLIVTNVYHRESSAWRMVLHQASPPPPPIVPQNPSLGPGMGPLRR